VRLVESLFDRLSSEIDVLKKSFTFASITATAKRPHSTVTPKASQMVDTPVNHAAKHKALIDAWESKPTLNGGHKGVCIALNDDIHLNPEN